MSLIAAKWKIDEYHRMIDAGILSDSFATALLISCTTMIIENFFGWALPKYTFKP
jgi:hypothetical protein